LSSLVSLYLGGALLLLMLLLGLALQGSVRQFLEGAVKDKAEALASQLATVTLDAVLIHDYGTIERNVDALVGREDIPFIQILRHDGQVLGQAGMQAADLPLVTMPIMQADLKFGDVVVQYDDSRLARITRQMTIYTFAGTGLLTLLFFLMLRRFLNLRVIRPIHRLVEQMGPDSQGTIAPDPGAPREVIEMADSFNALQQKIERHIRELDQAHETHNEAIRRLCSDQRLATIGQMAAELAHEMNTPLSNVLGYAQTALSRSGDEEVQRRLLVVVEQARRLSQIVRDMMAAAHPPEAQGVAVDPGELLASIARLLPPILRKQGAMLEIVSAGEGESCWADPTMTEQILFNLISNALQAGARHIVLALDDDDDTVTVDVRDDGAGVPPEVQDRLFEPFVTSKRRGEGTGLGLSISQRLAREMNGDLRLVGSRPGCTEFRLTLPRRQHPIEELHEVQCADSRG
jgi:signal transduction histidine kinase